jgi:hypothetical protein
VRNGDLSAMDDKQKNLVQRIDRAIEQSQRSRKRALRLMIGSLILSTVMTVIFFWWMVHRARH